MFSARVLLQVFDSVYLLSLVCWVGAILFFSFGVAPIIFKVLRPDAAAAFVRALFPRYYLWGAISAAVALPAMLCVPLSFPEFRGPAVALKAFMIIGGILLMLYCGNSLTPAINAARDAGDPGKARFDQLHRRSVRLNVVSLLIGLALLILFAVRSAPVTNGIIEQSPQQRAEYDREVLGEIDRLMKGKPEPATTPEGSKFDHEGREELKAIFEAKRQRDAARKKSGGH